MIIQTVRLLILTLTCSMLVGCQCNYSRIHSALSDEQIESRLAASFDGVRTQDEKVDRAHELIDTDTVLGVFEESGGSDLHFIIGRRFGCQFFWPIMPDANMLVRFDESNQYISFDRWDIWQYPRTEYKWNSESLAYTYRGQAKQFYRVSPEIDSSCGSRN